ncbi:hypothetical protein OBBRIDRAFT_808483 [Obba rivulosa]|uniref:Uncharacterized protein n=1 Tax=Obba rivulosa TaxID=1052685 RepID=A0A8E2AGR3_9APHY|nr:hypothetical protein OBBRIDRAFT_808483 [Obba rivulosa]
MAMHNIALLRLCWALLAACLIGFSSLLITVYTALPSSTTVVGLCISAGGMTASWIALGMSYAGDAGDLRGTWLQRELDLKIILLAINASIRAMENIAMLLSDASQVIYPAIGAQIEATLQSATELTGSAAQPTTAAEPAQSVEQPIDPHTFTTKWTEGAEQLKGFVAAVCKL